MNEEYYAFGHASKFVAPGTRYLITARAVATVTTSSATIGVLVFHRHPEP